MRDRGLLAVGVLAVLLVGGGIAVYLTVIVDDRIDTIGPSMRPTLDNRLRLEIDEDAYRSELPAIGDIVAAQAPVGVDTASCGGLRRAGAPCGRPAVEYSAIRVLKRVVARPGDRIAFTPEGRMVRNGQAVPEPYIRECSGSCALPRAIIVPEGYYFLAGDNRPVSVDSRDWGPVRLDAIDGKVILP